MKKSILFLLFNGLLMVGVYSQDYKNIQLPSNVIIESINTYNSNLIIRYLTKESGFLSDITNEYVWCNGKIFGPFIPYNDYYFALEGILNSYQHYADIDIGGNYYVFAARDKEGYILVINGKILRCKTYIDDVAISRDGQKISYISLLDEGSYIIHLNQDEYILETNTETGSREAVELVKNSLNANRLIVKSNLGSFYELKNGKFIKLENLVDMYINYSGEIIVSVHQVDNNTFIRVNNEEIGPYESIIIDGVTYDKKKIIYSSYLDGICTLHSKNGDISFNENTQSNTIGRRVITNELNGVAYSIWDKSNNTEKIAFGSNLWGPFYFEPYCFDPTRVQMIFNFGENLLYYTAQDIKTKKYIIFRNNKPIIDPQIDIIFGVYYINSIYYFYPKLSKDKYEIKCMLGGNEYSTVGDMMYFPIN